MPVCCRKEPRMQRILVALDGSPESEQILGEVERVSTRHTAIDLLHVAVMRLLAMLIIG